MVVVLGVAGLACVVLGLVAGGMSDFVELWP